MVVVADSSPLIVLINIGHVGVLRDLFGTVVIPPQVSLELQSSRRPQLVREFMEHRPQWLVEKSPTSMEPIPSLHAGEQAAIARRPQIRGLLDLETAFEHVKKSDFWISHQLLDDRLQKHITRRDSAS